MSHIWAARLAYFLSALVLGAVVAFAWLRHNQATTGLNDPGMLAPYVCGDGWEQGDFEERNAG